MDIGRALEFLDKNGFKAEAKRLGQFQSELDSAITYRIQMQRDLGDRIAGMEMAMREVAENLLAFAQDSDYEFPDGTTADLRGWAGDLYDALK